MMNQRSIPFVCAIVLLAAACADPEVAVQGDYGDSKADTADSIARGPSLFWPRAGRGDSNQDITVVQYLLLQNGEIAPLDGAFGASTEAAVRRFQTQHQLLADGIVGEQTWLALIVDAKRGDGNAAVSAIQYLLKNRYAKSLDVTGQFGPTTEQRVQELQRSVCLEATGIVGIYTWNALVARRTFCGDGNPDGTAAQRALAYHQQGKLTLWNETFGRHDGADPLANISDAAANRPAHTSCYGGAPCTTVRLSSGLLSGMAGLRERYGFSYFVTAIAGASHSAGSYHYAGRAVDIDTVNGVTISGDSAMARRLMAACTQMGAVEVLGPSNDPSHQDHVHCAW